MGDELTALDATFLELEEADDSAHMHIGAVALFQPPAGRAPPSLDEVRAETEARLDDLPRYRQRLSSQRTGGLHWPRWVEDERFRIERHVTAAQLPRPGGTRELLAWAGGYFSQRLDRTRPLWEIVLIGMGDGRWALVSKTHHCMVDGVGSVELAHTLFDVEPEAPSRAARRATPPHARGGPEEGNRAYLPSLVGGGLRLATAPPRLAGRLVRGAALRAWRGATSPTAEARRAADTLRRAAALAELIVRDEVIPAPHTSLNDPIGARRRLATLSVPLAGMKQIRAALGGTVNDVVLAAASGGFRELLMSRGEPLPSRGLRAMVPVSIRGAADRLAVGNRITSLFVNLPIAEEDPLARYRTVTEEAEGLKSGSQAQGSLAVLDLTGYAPPIVHSFLARSLYATRLFNVTITNVPGPQRPLYAFGSRLRAVWPLVPLAANHAVGVAVFSYDGDVCFSLNADRDAVPDLDVLASGISSALDELRRLAVDAERRHVRSTAG